MSVFASLFGKETLIGLDIGSAYLKAVQVDVLRRGFRVVRAVQQKTPEGSVRDGIVVDKDAVGAALRQMLRAGSISATGAVVAVSGPTVTVRQIKLPRMPEAALRKSIRYEASKYITANIEDSMVEFEILSSSTSVGAAESDQMNVMLVAAPREMVESRIAAVESAGLEAVAVDIEAFALQRCLFDCNVHHFNDGNLRALVDMGASHTEVTILNGIDFALTRSIAIAGDTFNNVFKNQGRYDAAEAELRKVHTNLAALLDPNADPDELEDARTLQPMMDELLREVRRSIHFYQSQLPEDMEKGVLAEIILSGGTAQLPGLPEYMTARLGTEVRLGNPFENAFFESPAEARAFLHDQHPRLGIALGLAIKEFMPATTAIPRPAPALATVAAAAADSDSNSASDPATTEDK